MFELCPSVIPGNSSFAGWRFLGDIMEGLARLREGPKFSLASHLTIFLPPPGATASLAANTGAADAIPPTAPSVEYYSVEASGVSYACR